MKAFYSKEEVLGRIIFFPGWEFKDNAIEKSFVFKDFQRAFAFMTIIAMEAERMDHHPDWSNSWNKVRIRLSTHEAGGVTDKDFMLMERIEKFAPQP